MQLRMPLDVVQIIVGRQMHQSKENMTDYQCRRHPAQHTRNGFSHREATLTIWQCHISYVGHHREYNIDILRVDLNGISVTSVYKPPGERFSFHQSPTAIGDQQQVIIGDFNSHSSTWGYATTTTAGKLVEDWAGDQSLRLIHDPKLPSSFKSGRWRRGYNPDIIFATNRIAGCCNTIMMKPAPRSQHRPIGVQANAVITVQTVPFRLRFNLKKAN